VVGACSPSVGFGRLVAVKPGDGRVVGHPPVTFPFYGLLGWDGPRWVEFFEGAQGHPVTTLWLGHRRRDSRAHLSVGSSTDRGVPGMSDIDSELAFAVAFVLTERMRPDRSTAPLPAGSTASSSITSCRSPSTTGSGRSWAAWSRAPSGRCVTGVSPVAGLAT